MKLGIDIGSTTIKLILLSTENHILYKKYEHMSNVFDKFSEMIGDLVSLYPDIRCTVAITGSGGMAISNLWESILSRRLLPAAPPWNGIYPRPMWLLSLAAKR